MATLKDLVCVALFVVAEVVFAVLGLVAAVILLPFVLLLGGAAVAFEWAVKGE